MQVSQFGQGRPWGRSWLYTENRIAAPVARGMPT